MGSLNRHRTRSGASAAVISRPRRWVSPKGVRRLLFGRVCPSRSLSVRATSPRDVVPPEPASGRDDVFGGATGRVKIPVDLSDHGWIHGRRIGWSAVGSRDPRANGDMADVDSVIGHLTVEG